MFIKYSKGTIKDIHKDSKEAVEEMEKEKQASENNENEDDKINDN